MTIDLARAIARIDPHAEYRLNHSQADGKQKIIEWRGPGDEPTVAELAAAWTQVEAAQDITDAAQAALEAKIAAARAEVNAADFAVFITAVEATADLAKLKVQVAALAELTGRLAEAGGMTPVTPSIAVTP